MNPSSTKSVTRDEDLAARRLAIYGEPSQNPDPAAQLPLTAAESEREAGSALVGGGAVAGAATGAAVGAAVAGPIGGLVGGTVGAVAGVLGGAAAGSLVTPDSPANTIPDPQDREIRRVGEAKQEDLRR
ncbi:bacteriocin [Acidovorax sp.]|uniref:bacteriocin n=1 Tax=Acidovorax sp. TaxID=1872122 RepID=UPI0025C3E85D|nr:bacteriocin [Acidovorax sp.]